MTFQRLDYAGLFFLTDQYIGNLQYFSGITFFFFLVKEKTRKPGHNLKNKNQ